MALISDHCHEVVVAPFEFDLTESGVAKLLMIADEYASRLNAGSVRFGVEAAGHCHRGLVTTLDTAGRDVVEVNPAIVKDARGRIGQRRVKTDVQDCLAMAEVLIDGLGHTPDATKRCVGDPGRVGRAAGPQDRSPPSVDLSTTRSDRSRLSRAHWLL